VCAITRSEVEPELKAPFALKPRQVEAAILNQMGQVRFLGVREERITSTVKEAKALR